MIIYGTKQTIERFKFPITDKLPDDLRQMAKLITLKEQGTRLFEWGAKIFYFDGRKCLQVVNFASKFTLFLFDLKVSNVKNVGNLAANYMFEIYKEDKEMQTYLEKYFAEAPIVCFEKLTDRSAIATLNHTQLEFADDGYAFFRYIENGVLQTLKINRIINFDWFFTMKINGKTEYITSGVRFKELLKERYGKNRAEVFVNMDNSGMLS